MSIMEPMISILTRFSEVVFSVSISIFKSSSIDIDILIFVQIYVQPETVSDELIKNDFLSTM